MVTRHDAMQAADRAILAFASAGMPGAIAACVRAACAANDLNAHYGVMSAIYMLCAGGGSLANGDGLREAGAVEALAESARGMCWEARPPATLRLL